MITEIIIHDEANEVIKELFDSRKNRYQNNSESVNGMFVLSLSSIRCIYCLINVIKQIRIVVDHL